MKSCLTYPYPQFFITPRSSRSTDEGPLTLLGVFVFLDCFGLWFPGKLYPCEPRSSPKIGWCHPTRVRDFFRSWVLNEVGHAFFRFFHPDSPSLKRVVLPSFPPIFAPETLQAPPVTKFEPVFRSWERFLPSISSLPCHLLFLKSPTPMGRPAGP